MRMFLPLILTYVLIVGGLSAWALAAATASSAGVKADPRFGKAMRRILFYAALWLSAAMLAASAFARFIDFGFTWGIYVLAPAALMTVFALYYLASIMVGDVRRTLTRPAKTPVIENKEKIS